MSSGQLEAKWGATITAAREYKILEVQVRGTQMILRFKAAPSGGPWSLPELEKFKNGMLWQVRDFLKSTMEYKAEDKVDKNAVWDVDRGNLVVIFSAEIPRSGSHVDEAVESVARDYGWRTGRL